MARGQGMNGINVGKVHVYSSDESLEKVMEIFMRVMEKTGEVEEADDVGQMSEEEDGEMSEEKSGEDESPWVKAARRMRKDGSTG